MNTFVTLELLPTSNPVSCHLNDSVGMAPTQCLCRQGGTCCGSVPARPANTTARTKQQSQSHAKHLASCQQLPSIN